MPDFFDEVVTTYGVPIILVIDNGTNFVSRVFANTCKVLGIRKVITAPYYPQGNGSFERSHRPLV